MKLSILGSSSSGNGYAFVSSDGEIFLLEAGVKPRQMIKGIDYRLGCVSGCVVSHAHQDHALYITPYSKFGFPVGCNSDVAGKKNLSHPIVMEDGKTYGFGSYHVTPFSVKHDVPNFGYLIHHKEMGTALFATDTYTLPFEFRNVDHFLIEANYDDDILKENVMSNKINVSQRDRLMVSHMSIKNCIRNLKRCEAENSKNIILIHLSSRNSDATKFRQKVAAQFAVPTYIAEKNKTIEL